MRSHANGAVLAHLYFFAYATRLAFVIGSSILWCVGMPCDRMSCRVGGGAHALEAIPMLVASELLLRLLTASCNGFLSHGVTSSNNLRPLRHRIALPCSKVAQILRLLTTSSNQNSPLS